MKANTHDVNLNDILKLIREIQDSVKKANHGVKPFADDDCWYTDYKCNCGKIQRFEYLNTDPRIIADQAVNALKDIEKNAFYLFHKLYEQYRPITGQEQPTIILSNKKDDNG